MAEERIALVLAGGGARGAYEAGALNVLLPELERLGQRPTMYLGTSVGSLNAVVLAGCQHLSAADATGRLVEIWGNLTKNEVIRPIIFPTGPKTVLRYAGELLSLPGVRMPSVLDPSPLQTNLEHWVDWHALHVNVEDGALDVVAAVATSTRTGRTVVFAESAGEPTLHRSHEIAYVPARLEHEHVRASAAIPLLFPPVRVNSPPKARGWYVDGGTRLNAPIKPAIDLGADRIVVIATDSIAGPVMEETADDDDAPDFGAGVGHLLEGMLVDPLVEDMRLLGAINAFHTEPGQDGIHLYRTVRGKPPYRTLPYAFIGPQARGEIGVAAAEMFRSRFSGLNALRAPDLKLMSRIIGGESPTHGEVLSLLFFDPEFHQELIRMGEADARRWLDEEHDEGPWQIGPLTTFTRPRSWTAG